MNKSELIDAIAAKTDLDKATVDSAISGMFDVVSDVVGSGDEKISIPGIISFQRTERKARKGRNPRTGEAIDIPASKAIKVTAGSKLKAAAKGN